MTYSVKEIYYTLQGEGGQAGRAAVFLRFTGCNLWTGREEDRSKAVCTFCDTDFVGTNGPGGGKFDTAEALSPPAPPPFEAWLRQPDHTGPRHEKPPDLGLDPQRCRAAGAALRAASARHARHQARTTGTSSPRTFSTAFMRSMPGPMKARMWSSFRLTPWSTIALHRFEPVGQECRGLARKVLKARMVD